ncbi:MAG: 1-deoxy-D-xylulose-5-phosphate synthase [Pirellulales bacterium]|nr:1-deoxy-D-xylulose-5-phosphate synthase [Pirellulales bacterium]
MDNLLSTIQSPRDLTRLSLSQLEQLATEMRLALCELLAHRTAHFASNLGVVELCLALHREFDFSHDRLIWDTGHQIYPHKLITGRYQQFDTIRTKGGLMGYPNPAESPYDLFMTGHAGCSVSTALGLRSGDELLGQDDRHSVAVIGDGALPSGIVFEALNNAGGLKSKLLVVLNDNKMSICNRVGGLAEYLDRLRTNDLYNNFKHEVSNLLKKVPLVGDQAEQLLWQMKESLKQGLHMGMLFEEMGLRYIGPIDGHNLAQLGKYLKMVRKVDGPVVLHVVTNKGHGFEPAERDPVYYHTPAPFRCGDNAEVIPLKKSSSQAYTDIASQAIHAALEHDPRVTVMTAAMCQGNKLEAVREKFPTRFFDTGICESHAVAFAAGQAKTGLRPIVDIYSTFLQRSYDQIFQEVALQDLPVTFMLDRAGLTGPDGPTHHGCFDIGYMRLFPNLTVMAPGDSRDLREMLSWALSHGGPCSLRYPKANAVEVKQERDPIEYGRSEVFSWGADGMLIACGTLLPDCLRAAEILREAGYDVGVINARFIKPLDTDAILRALTSADFVVTVEEGTLMTGFGSAVLEAAADAGINAAHLTRLGIPDRFIEHGERAELLAELKLDVDGIVQTCLDAASRAGVQPRESSVQRQVS